MDTAEEAEGVELETGVEDATDSVVLRLVLEISVVVVCAIVWGRVFEVDVAIVLCELSPSLTPPDPPVESRTLGQSVLTPAFVKNMPMSVSGYALVPLH